MRKISMMPILVLAMALGFVSCSASDDGVNDGMLGQQPLHSCLRSQC